MFSIYLHIPFCAKRCPYCDFNTYAGQNNLIPAYVDALRKELKTVASLNVEKAPVHTVFIGGGTPSILTIEQISSIMNSIEENYDLSRTAEISMEANPGTVSYESLRSLRDAGINRLSFGVQSFIPEELRLLGRIHNGYDALRAVEWARKANFDNINLDLIFGLPSQSLQDWQSTLCTAVGLQPEHLSLYALTIEENTLFDQWILRGMMALPDDDLAAEMYEWADNYLEETGYHQYEISNWAKKTRQQVPVSNLSRDYRCLHNLQYWRNLPYLGFGAGAHGSAIGIRTANVNGILDYISRMRTGIPDHFPLSPANMTVTPIDYWTEIQETMMVGLRLTDEGVGRQKFFERFGIPLEAIFSKQISQLEGEDLVEISEMLRLTKRGRLLGNRVFGAFVNAEIRPDEG